MNRKLIVLISVLISVFAFSAGIFAAEPTPWDGTVDTSWYSTDKTSFELNDAKQLAGLAVIVNGTAEGISKDDFTGKTVTLTADLDLGGVQAADGTWSGKSWNRIGYGINSYTAPVGFNGTFDGNGKEIRNLYMNVSSTYQGLFGAIGEKAVVQKVNIASGYVKSTQGSVAGVIGMAADGAAVYNCSNRAEITGGNYAAGIVGYFSGSKCTNGNALTYTGSDLWNCVNYGKITCTATYAGGVSGYFIGVAKNCYNRGEVIGKGQVGGLLGFAVFGGSQNGHGAALINCYNAGKVTDGLGIAGRGKGQTWVKGANITANNTYWLKGTAENCALDQSKKPMTVAGASICESEADIDLGAAYTKVDGKIMLKWEQKDSNSNYQYDAEKQGLAIDNVKIANGSIEITLNKLLAYTPVFAKDFGVKVTKEVSGEAAVDYDLALTESTLGSTDQATVLTLKFKKLPGEFKDFTLHFTVSFNGKDTKVDLLVPMSVLWTDYAAAEFAGGSGTVADPYRIETAEQLAKLAVDAQKGESYSGKYFKQTADIDLTQSTVAGNGAKLHWVPIKSFMGSFDGDNHKISHMTIRWDDPDSASVGLFGQVSGVGDYDIQCSRLNNIYLDAVDIKVDSNEISGVVGALAGRTSRSYIRNCHVLSGDITVEGAKRSYAGGLVGRFLPNANGYGGELTRYVIGCSSGANVTAPGIVGGLIAGATDNSSYSGGVVRGNVLIKDCSVTGNLTSNTVASEGILGGIVGDAQRNLDFRMENCYFAGSAQCGTDMYHVGGLVGSSAADATYTTNTVYENNAVLCDKITGSMKAGYSAGRVGGVASTNGENLPVVFKNNYVLDTMYLLTMVIPGDGGDNYTGTAKTAGDFAEQTTWDALHFDMSESGLWTWDAATKRPVLKGVSGDFKAVYGIEFFEQPVDGTVYGNRATTFYVESAGGCGEHTYQWQLSADQGATWITPLTVKAKERVFEYQAPVSQDGWLVRCEVTDEVGTKAYSDSAVLHVFDNDYDVTMGANALYRYYQKNGATVMTTPVALYSYDNTLGDIKFNLPYAGIYQQSEGKDDGRTAWAILDSMAQGYSPLLYDKGNGEVADLISSALDGQTAQGTGAFIPEVYRNADKKYVNNGYNIESNVYYFLALDTFFSGEEWDNTSETAGRTAAFHYLTGLVNDMSDVEGGKYFLSMTKYGGTRDELGGSYAAMKALAVNADFAVAMARVADDEVLGKEALSNMYGVLAMLEDKYDNGGMKIAQDGVSTQAHYLSALIAGANATSSKSKAAHYMEKAEEVFLQISLAQAKDGGYAATYTEGSLADTSDGATTAAVMMAFADYTKGRSILAEMNFDSTAKDMMEADLAAIEIPEEAAADLTLVTAGRNGSVITWASSNADVIGTDGKVHRGETDVTVTLTATASLKGETLSKTFDVFVPAATVAGGDDVRKDAATLTLYPEYLTDIPAESLPTEGANGTTITWKSSNLDVISNDGKVTRPALGKEAAMVTMTATVAKGDAAKDVSFDIKVWETVDTATNEGMVKETYYQTRATTYRKTTLNGYWDAWTAYAALGEDVANLNLIYDQSNITATQRGANILALVELGYNPYNYDGKNYVKELTDAGLGGTWSEPVFNVLGADAAGIRANKPISAVIDWTKNFGMGPDIGGWAAVVLAHHMGVDIVGTADAKVFVENVAENMTKGLSGEGTSTAISKGCVVQGLTALYKAGYTGTEVSGVSGLNVITDTPWVNKGENFDAVPSIYNTVKGSFGGTSYTYELALFMCDLYNVYYGDRNVSWLECGITKAKLDAQVAKANAILADEAEYDAASVKNIKAALDGVSAISEDRLNAKIADYGEEYYALYDAVRYAKLAGQSEMDQAAADKVAEQINALNDEITLADKEAVDAAKAAYDALTNDQKALVAEEVKAKLTAAVDTIAGLEQAEVDKEAAANVINEINKINENVTLDDQSAVAAARAAYDALTKEQKALVTNLDKLTKAEGTIKELLEKDNGKVKNMTDVIEGQWYYDDVAYALDNNIFKGTSDTTFSPNQAMTRAMFVTVLGRNAGVEDSSASYPSTSVFDDVANDAYYASHVKWAVENGITIGVSKTEFAPNAQISRQDMATMMLRYAKAMGIRLPEMSKELFGDDADIAVYAKEAVYKLKAVEIINGKDGNIFDPKGSTTRAEVAAVLHRFLTYKYEDFVKVDDTDSVIVDIEKFTLGQGFIMEPTVVKLQEGDSAADVTLRAAEQAGVELQYRGTGFGFYLSAVRDDETREANIPQYILDAMKKAGAELIGRDNQTWLSEKDYNSAQGGWIYWVNHVHMGKSAEYAEMKAGDVIRWQFTVYGMGLDLGAKVQGATPYVTVGDKDALLHAMAVASNHEKAGQAYENAVKVMEKMDATQAEINAATEALND